MMGGDLMGGSCHENDILYNCEYLRIVLSWFIAPFVTHRKARKLLTKKAMYNYQVADRGDYKYF